ncbi:LysR substrate-binding domain-containing protein [Bradyrhizobium sp. JYMT SZCCT0428]|uniref:LysR substrate-binding domain-containing protein n=1 Tax=Bradyrhizobium sp. JYMT SZCCT0428 TaxID=2807673 RepID=UPI001BADBFEE|nr:LysR substrate-binding domain-containing protein [Bradyrhizobium sp. JYMT SZCCT0428]MBR1153286.1 LysR family transcriptional regulator [Bradyrhizobium sp. JYMT SZCCT0428]
MRRRTKLSHLPLNALRAFEATARNLSFTRAGLELRVTQAAVSQQVKALEDRLGAQLFRRLPRGVALTDEGQLLLPSIVEAFGRLNEALNRFEDGRYQDVITIGVVGTFASGWLLPRLDSFRKAHPRIDLRLFVNNNRVDIAGEGLDYAIRFGDGLWHGTEAIHLMAAPLTPFCAPAVARRLKRPADLKREELLRSYRQDEWSRWFAAAGLLSPVIKGMVFDSSITIASVAARGAGVALLPAEMFRDEVLERRLVRPFKTEVTLGDYWITSLHSRRPSSAMLSFKSWLLESITAKTEAPARNTRSQ